MNRILFEKSEISGGEVTLSDVRAAHILGVLHGEVGDVLKVGEVNGLIGTGEIVSLAEGRVTLRLDLGELSLAPWVDLILAPPRPRVLKRLLPQLAALGVGRIFLVGAKKVEKDFWGATLLKESEYRPLLIDGLMQAGTSILPTIEAHKSFRRFLREILPTLPHVNRIVAHPYGATSASSNTQPPTLNPQPSRLLLAIGPEGGWTDEEVEALEKANFRRLSLGKRILRTDTATVALLARLMKD